MVLGRAWFAENINRSAAKGCGGGHHDTSMVSFVFDSSKGAVTLS